ncbi:MAG: prenyltransferase [Thaumarchaeota archaeon]|nr:prenyltransferase [Nitrososphaerota archaeon]
MKTFLRITRAQFLPVILVPIIVGTAVAWHSAKALNPIYMVLALIGSALLLLAANIVDDIYDYVNGIDPISDRMFPPDFPGWKVIPRGLVTLGKAKTWAFLCYLGALLLASYFAFMAGIPSLILAVLGIGLSYFYVAPPIKAAYRGLGLGELDIFVNFGPIPALGAYFVQTLRLDLLPVVAAIPSGLLTASVLINHDLIFHDPYVEGGKRSIAVLLGRRSAMKLCTAIGVACYLYVAILALLGVFPLTTLAVFPALLVFARQLGVYAKKEQNIPNYARATSISFIHSVVFGILLSLGFFFA